MKPLILQLPEHVRRGLEAEARRSNTNLEDCAIALLESRLAPQDDPLANLVGTLTADTDDIADRHDAYLGDAIQGEFGRE